MQSHKLLDCCAAIKKLVHIFISSSTMDINYDGVYSVHKNPTSRTGNVVNHSREKHLFAAQNH